MLTDNQGEFLDYVLLGNKQAIAFCNTLWGISQTWDDIVDFDKDYDVNKMMWDALIVLPNNPFYQQHFDQLNPIMQTAIIDWMDSNKLVTGSKEAKVAAYVLRDTITTIIIHCAGILGGYEWMTKISIEVREALYDEPIDKFLGEHDNG